MKRGRVTYSPHLSQSMYDYYKSKSLFSKFPKGLKKIKQHAFFSLCVMYEFHFSLVKNKTMESEHCLSHRKHICQTYLKSLHFFLSQNTSFTFLKQTPLHCFYLLASITYGSTCYILSSTWTQTCNNIHCAFHLFLLHIR